MIGVQFRQVGQITCSLPGVRSIWLAVSREAISGSSGLTFLVLVFRGRLRALGSTVVVVMRDSSGTWGASRVGSPTARRSTEAGVLADRTAHQRCDVQQEASGLVTGPGDLVELSTLGLPGEGRRILR
ncbi:hypothetical protein EAO77_38395 [Streptomyces sp. t39]|nr:hypothetical protein EAO77_38395 [Streptomyces sp. t39]